MSFFTYFASLTQAARLFFPAVAGVAPFCGFFWFFTLSGLISLFFKGLEFSLFFLVVGVGYLIAGFLLFQLLRVIYWGGLRLIWRNPPQLLKVSSFNQSIWGFGILAVASLPPAVVAYLPLLLDFYLATESAAHSIEPIILAPAAMLRYSWLWFLSAACLSACFPTPQTQREFKRERMSVSSPMSQKGLNRPPRRS